MYNVFCRTPDTYSKNCLATGQNPEDEGVFQLDESSPPSITPVASQILLKTLCLKAFTKTRLKSAIEELNCFNVRFLSEVLGPVMHCEEKNTNNLV